MSLALDAVLIGLVGSGASHYFEGNQLKGRNQILAATALGTATGYDYPPTKVLMTMAMAGLGALGLRTRSLEPCAIALGIPAVFWIRLGSRSSFSAELLVAGLASSAVSLIADKAWDFCADRIRALSDRILLEGYSRSLLGPAT